jgi:putative inorganic carbon (hco3(-)) transporter
VIRSIRNLSPKLSLFYGISLIFLLLNIWFCVKKDTYAASLIPFLFVIVLLAIYSVDRLLLLIVFLTPLSIPLTQLIPRLQVDLFLPTEPLLFGILILFILKLTGGVRIDKTILRHPVTIVTGIWLLWIFITCFTSSMPLVSFKFLVVKIWYITGFYILAIGIFHNRLNYQRFVWLYVSALIIVIGYTISRHLGYGLFDKQAAHFVMNPFYKDHTSYGAILAMFIPFISLFTFSSFYKPVYRWISGALLLILMVAFFLSYARAAWLSLFVALVIWIIMKLGIRLRVLVVTIISVLAVILVFQKQIVMYLERNTEESSANLVEHFSSISNISSDASNLERINRWSCAIRMFQDKPLFGYGPGTYMFKYAPYQLTKDRTIISTNSGDLGNAHSEYLGPLAESGFLGTFTFLLLVLTVFSTAYRTWFRLKDYRLKTILMGAFLGLITYYGHGFMNNFLDTDKASVPFWGFTAMIVTIDIFSRKDALPQTE